MDPNPALAVHTRCPVTQLCPDPPPAARLATHRIVRACAVIFLRSAIQPVSLYYISEGKALLRGHSFKFGFASVSE